MLRQVFRVLVGSVLVLAGILAVSYMQKRFDDGDVRRAEAAVRAKVSGLPVTQACVSEMTSRFRGQVKVTCGVRAWLVDVVHATLQEIHP